MSRVQRLSTGQVMRIARERFIRISSKQQIDLSTLQHFFDAAKFDLCCEETKDVELAILLLAAAHKLHNKQFAEAGKFLNLCDFLSSITGNSVQRIVHYFTKALRERLARETGTVTTIESENKEGKLIHPQQTTACLIPSLIATYLQLPYTVTQFAGIQTVLEHLESARKVHFIDLAIKTGGHCTILMQALANQNKCPIELLKITAVGKTTSKLQMEEVGERLACFAKTLNLPFTFKTAIVYNIKDLKEEMFDLSHGEVVAIYSRTILRNIITQTDCLECLMRVLRKTHPCIFVVHEIEANHNSLVFIDRFLEALLHYYSAHFDCLDVCLERCDPNRIVWETCLAQEIQDIVAVEDDARIFRDMKIDEWRAYFTRLKMVETEISVSSLSQAQMALKNFASGKSCTLDRNDKSIITRWKGTPLLSLSAWKFHQQDQSKKSCAKKSKTSNCGMLS
ncbi:hypothetical protein JCGZ_18984 [Jatropha curcas]|uniref:GRAS38 protein n=1 Tax=Jatropha curcas TaxID=180498 RepID=A0A067K7V9_JATCU|nr:DELLA protein RGL2 [Jatropha curcas]AMR43780.1 GRAS38 protein [Jatropha curcas]KDP27904.1 hypothetical protein JCGZ_18984 [Jatropha curcas]